ncbi:tetratricopeptide repeat protein [Mangrovimonas spongiae]|uniref:Tetratricopeptide repeat protein n=1 Tax=Mangrovimonas spongiae TaxID=2494697 RepID=A0A3R9N998_9FLAO|nr:tetratricopeptide repeat protein [Mangrovimonas spongiae]RSK41931.1 tetratricopeptide repeat protein [Mangrovimonas spongiae]
MKTKITLLITVLFLGLGVTTAQNEDLNTLSIMTEYAKAKNFDAAYKPFMELRERNPKYHRGIYKYGEDILDDKIEKATGAEKVAYINDLLKLWEQRATYFASKTPKGEYGAKACQLMYDYRKELNKTDEELYACFDAAYKADPKTFTNPKSLYTYFSLMVDLYDAGKKQPAELFNKYDDVVEKVESEVSNYSEKLNKLIEKEDAGTALTSRDKSYKRYYESYLKAYDQISSSIDSKLGERADCENLIPLYTKDFDANKNDAVWLQRAMSMMYQKGCTDDALFVKVVEQKNSIEPDANTAFYVGILKDKAGQSSEALKYYEQALSLETDGFKKAKLYNKIAIKLKSKGSYSKARNYFREALKLNPSNGRPHLSIAGMYASSANSCGDSSFNKRAVFWLAAIEAEKAGRVDPTLKSSAAQTAANYRAKAPQKSDIFSKGNAGETIRIGCWIGASVTVPQI